MKCIIGLGNPGKQYELTRHNMGFMVIDQLCKDLGISCNEKKFKALYTKTKINNEDVLIVKPQTFMNLSGEAVVSLINYYKIPVENILVISDDLDLPFGKIRFKPSGSDGGQRGLRNIIEQLKTKDFTRCRIGISKDKVIPTIDWVMKKIESNLLPELNKVLALSSEACQYWVKNGTQMTMNEYNGIKK